MQIGNGVHTTTSHSIVISRDTADHNDTTSLAFGHGILQGIAIHQLRHHQEMR
jgi:hypothetical protein